LSIQQALGSDVEYEIRQLGAVGIAGPGASFTGLKTDPWKGHRTGADYAVQGNMLVGEETLIAMTDSFTASVTDSLGERLLRALEAGQAAGGDRRGRQSAAILVAGTEDYPLVDLRVDEHRDPVAELRRIFEVAKVELFPLVAALPTKRNPRGSFDSIRDAVAPKK
jgi:uncharacterized Ntn-hydrolase superfamily protein